MDVQLGFWADPIYLTGDYPAHVKEVMKNHAHDHEYIAPRFTAEEILENKEAADFFGLNHYTSRLYRPTGDGGIEGITCLAWPRAGSGIYFH